MTEKSRTEYSARNTTIAMFSRIIAIVMGYVTRVVFTHTLSESYVGINGLFTDILNVLALSELGIGTAITYALYRPIAEKDIERQKSLMKLFQNMYRIVALLITAAGLLIIPFMDFFVHDADDVGNVLVIYLLYLANSVVSYLFVYKKTLIDAHQLSYIGVMYHTVFLLIQDVFQMALLLLTHNFILYLLVYLVCTIGNNVCVARKADRLYPYLREKDIAPLPKEERKGIVRNIRAMLMHKIGNVVVNNTDNLLLSVMVGIVSVGKYSNYYLIIGSIRQVLDQAFQGITASVGNLGVTEDKEKVKTVFESSFFIGQWLYGFATICLYELINPFVSISFGSKYLFAQNLVLVLCMNFFVTGMRQATLVFRDSLGLFWYDRYKSLAEAAINLLVSIVLTLRFGVVGVFLGTFVSTMTTSFWIEPYVLYRKRLQAPLFPYFAHYAVYSVVLAAAGWITNAVCTQVTGSVVQVLILRLLICAAVPNLLWLLLYHRTKEFRYICGKLWELKTGEPAGAKKEEAAKPLSETESQLVDILCCAMREEKPAPRYAMSDEEWRDVLDKANRHAVLPLMYEILIEQQMPKMRKDYMVLMVRKTVRQSYRLLYRSHILIERLREHNVSAAVLKGVATAGVYPVPELRKSGDIDFLLTDETQLEQAKEAAQECGYTVTEEQVALHHLVMINEEGIELELHTMLAEPFDNSKINHYLKSCLAEIPEHIVQKEVMGYEFPVLSDGYHAYELLLHMLQHFLRSGFGLKLLCDWVYFWNRPVDDEELSLYLRLTKESGLSGFSDMITSVCVYFLILDPECGLCRRTERIKKEIAFGFLKDILEAEEFGKSGTDRMVTLRGTHLVDYIREFHHQMHLNYPKAGMVFLFWPALWCSTLYRFHRNNRTIRKLNGAEILKKAGERSRRMESLKLFEKEK